MEEWITSPESNMSHKKRRERKAKSVNGEGLSETRRVQNYTVHLEAKTENQKKYIQSIKDNTIVFVTGPAGSGKSFVALAYALGLLATNQIEKIVIIRPLVQTKYNESKFVGALPGSLNDKVKEYLMGVWDSASVAISKEYMNNIVTQGIVEILPLSLVRGRSFHKSFVIVEEAQNIDAQSDAMRMVLTRIGQDSKMVINGDISQSDLPDGKKSALEDAIKRFKDTPEFGIVKLEKVDIQRNGIIKVILDKYEKA